ncbi:diaminopimelate decarboxylase [Endozoicomonas sp. SCSIO W0465]|uniref:diaminopimelate decarboxylase n=1 Tax=Endozoicomonas sp. SCSIO W0465 TaxID=2918516 RepID=UPI0020755D43|nr:diaminopimelate decarboxylase [Endozoicomonas sp. SCSIO W0465]USE39585.1 diaminopimelate decarboxylase [Endozoicomonas sp. SCSIO W0465]
MEWFTFQPSEKPAGKALFAEAIPVQRLASQYGTPLYVYSRKALEDSYLAYHQAMADWPHLICYAVKANGNLAVLNVLARLGAGFDIVSVGELERVLAAGGDPGKVVFSGVAKQRHEIRRALEVGVHCFNIESEQELQRIQEEAQAMGQVARISLRVNPDVDARTHPYISTGLKDNKFGIDIDRAPAVYARAAELSHIEVVGVDCHIGSQLTTTEPFLDALDRLLLLMDRLKALGIHLQHLDIGGGLGVQYQDETIPSPSDYLISVKQRLVEQGYGDLTLVVEPGRSIAARAGIMLTRVELIKTTEQKHFAIVDGAMNDLLRPAIYSAWHTIVNTVQHSDVDPQVYDIVGPVCESGDFLGKQRHLTIREGDLLAVYSAGAYGFVMSSNYNARNRAAEVMVDGTEAYVIRRRETIAEQFAAESLLP